MKVVELKSRDITDVADTLAALLAQARAGKIRGIMFAAHFGGTRHEMGIAGDYSNDLVKAIGTLWRMMRQLNIMADDGRDRGDKTDPPFSP